MPEPIDSSAAPLVQGDMTPRCGKLLRTGNVCNRPVGHTKKCGSSDKEAYKHSPKGQAATTRYKQGPVGRAAKARYSAGPAGRAAHRTYEISPKGRATSARNRNTPEYMAEYHKAYIKTPTGRLVVRKAGLTRRATKLKAFAEPFTTAELAAHLDVMGGCCVYCGGPHEHWDHVYPLALDGTHALSNLVPSCASCNLSKNDTLPLQWLLQ